MNAASALAIPDTGPLPVPTELVVVPTMMSPPIIQHILLANHFTHIKDLFATHRTALAPADLTVAWVRLAKLSKDPSERLSPDLQKFVDIMACATIDRMQQFTLSNLCSIIWAASKLKKDVAQSGMFKSFLKSWASEMETHMDGLELDQIRKCMSAITRVRYAASANWKLKMETVLTKRLASCTCPKTLAGCLVSAASLGFALHPSPAFREAIGTACAASFAGPDWRGTRDAARCACSTLWAAAVLGVPLGSQTVQTMLSHVTAIGTAAAAVADDIRASASSSFLSVDSVESSVAAVQARAGSTSGPAAAPAGLSPLDFAQVFWALSKLRYKPNDSELSSLLSATTELLPSAQPELLSTILWGLADLEVAPPASWLQLAYRSFERQLDAAAAEPLQALLHAAATLQLPAPQWSGRLMERLQEVDLRPLPDGNVVDLVMSMHALSMRPPPQLAHRLQEECIKRLAQRCAAATAGPAAAAAPAQAGSH